MGSEESLAPLCPFVVTIDSAEQFPYSFNACWSRTHERLYRVDTRRDCLGRHPNSKGDYSIFGYHDLVGVERKSMGDGQSTLLNRERYERFECELKNLARIPHGLVIVECDLRTFLANAPTTDCRSSQENARVLLGTLMSAQSEYRVPWVFAGSRDFAETYCFRFLERAFRKIKEQERADRNPGNARVAAEPVNPGPSIEPIGRVGDRRGEPAASAGRGYEDVRKFLAGNDVIDDSDIPF